MREVADLALQLPSGCRLWQATGGAQAWSDVFTGLMINRHGLDVLAWQQTKEGSEGKNAPKLIDPPEWFEDAALRESAMERKARALLRQEKALLGHDSN